MMSTKMRVAHAMAFLAAFMPGYEPCYGLRLRQRFTPMPNYNPRPGCPYARAQRRRKALRKARYAASRRRT